MSGYEDLIAMTPGFMPEDEGQALHAAALGAPRPSGDSVTWLEVGTYCGKSTLHLAAAARRRGAEIVTVDHHHGSEEIQPGWPWHDRSLVDPATGRLDTLPHLRRTLIRAGVEDVVSVLVATTEQVARWWRSPIGLLFLDGNHTDEIAQHDYRAFARWLVPAGRLVVHDVFADPAQGGQAPWRVVQRARRDGFLPVSTTGSLRVLRRPTQAEAEAASVHRNRVDRARPPGENDLHMSVVTERGGDLAATAVPQGPPVREPPHAKTTAAGPP